MWWMWAIGLAAAIMFFAVVEGVAFRHAERQWTLSRCIAMMGRDFPLSIWLCGVFAGSLAVHFFWPYCPFGTSLGVFNGN
jgi:hypothetical protein